MIVLEPWAHGANDIIRDETKRTVSPGSYFYSQGKAIVLAASYFQDSRLANIARGGTAKKHRHRIHLALFGQLMASFEYLTKEVIARSITLTDYLDSSLEKCDWIKVSCGQVLATRKVQATPGSVLIGPTLGWHSAKEVNRRYSLFFGIDPILASEVGDLDRLWILRHSVAHNAGLVTNHDAARLKSPELSERVVSMSETSIGDTFSFLSPVAERMVGIAEQSLLGRLRNEIALQGKNYTRDEQTYIGIKQLGQFVKSRTQELNIIGLNEYNLDFP